MSLYPSWLYKNRIDIDNRGSNQTLSGCQYRIVLTPGNFTFANAKADLSDLRFTASDENTLLDYWIESVSTNTKAVIWVKLPTMQPAKVGSIYAWCGNASATAVSTSSMMEVPSVGGDCTNIFSGVNTYIGVLDTYPAKGSIKVHILPTGSFQNKRVFCKFNTTNYADFIDCYIDASSRVVLRISRAGTVIVLQGSTVLAANQEHSIVFAWDSTTLTGSFRGWKYLYVNGNIEARRGNVMMPNNGSAAPFASGQLVTHSAADTAGSSFSGTLSAGAIYNTFKQEQHTWALHEKRKFYEITEHDKWQKNHKPVYRYAAGEPGIVYEPTIIYENGKYRMWHSTALHNFFIGYAESTDMITWTNKQPVIGQGYGGESGDCHRGFIKKWDGLYYCYYQNGSVAGGPVQVATSADGINWGNNQTALAINPSFTNGYHSPGVWRKSATEYIMWMDTERPEKYRYYTGVATANNPLGPFSMQRIAFDFAFGPLQRPLGNPIPILTEGSLLHMWGHGCPPEQPDAPVGLTVLPSEGQRIKTGNFGVSHKEAYAKPTIRIDQLYEFDQVSDFHIFYDGAHTWCASACNDNYTFNPSEFIAQVAFYRFSGTIEQLVTDLTYQVHAQQPGNATAGTLPFVAGNLLTRGGQILKIG